MAYLDELQRSMLEMEGRRIPDRAPGPPLTRAQAAARSLRGGLGRVPGYAGRIGGAGAVFGAAQSGVESIGNLITGRENQTDAALGRAFEGTISSARHPYLNTLAASTARTGSNILRGATLGLIDPIRRFRPGNEQAPEPTAAAPAGAGSVGVIPGSVQSGEVLGGQNLTDTPAPRVDPLKTLGALRRGETLLNRGQSYAAAQTPLRGGLTLDQFANAPDLEAAGRDTGRVSARIADASGRTGTYEGPALAARGTVTYQDSTAYLDQMRKANAIRAEALNIPGGYNDEVASARRARLEPLPQTSGGPNTLAERFPGKPSLRERFKPGNYAQRAQQAADTDRMNADTARMELELGLTGGGRRRGMRGGLGGGLDDLDGDLSNRDLIQLMRLQQTGQQNDIQNRLQLRGQDLEQDRAASTAGRDIVRLRQEALDKAFPAVAGNQDMTNANAARRDRVLKATAKDPRFKDDAIIDDGDYRDAASILELGDALDKLSYKQGGIAGSKVGKSFNTKTPRAARESLKEVEDDLKELRKGTYRGQPIDLSAKGMIGNPLFETLSPEARAVLDQLLKR